MSHRDTQVAWDIESQEIVYIGDKEDWEMTGRDDVGPEGRPIWIPKAGKPETCTMRGGLPNQDCSPIYAVWTVLADDVVLRLLFLCGQRLSAPEAHHDPRLF